LFLAAISSPKPVREWLLATIARVGALRQHMQEYKRAAAIASLVGNRSTKQALTLAKNSFRIIKMDRLDQDDFLTNKDTGLFQKTENVKLGDCDAFISHSWSDDPHEKWDKLVEFNKDFKINNEDQDAKVWLDKACINQEDIDASLACLPVFLSGCSQLLVVAGPTYVTRLWCVMELFTFVQMGGHVDRVVVRSVQGNSTIKQALADFHAERAMCYKVEDRQKLLAIIETSFGTFGNFNNLMRGLFNVRSSVAARISGIMASASGSAGAEASTSTKLLTSNESAPLDPEAPLPPQSPPTESAPSNIMQNEKPPVMGVISTLTSSTATATVTV